MEGEDGAFWQAVLRGDRGADGQFVYAVATTGIYCRPSCGARRPHPGHVRFFADGAAARQAGFRPCRRCRPDGPPPAELEARAVERACRAMESAAEPRTLEALAAAAGMSPRHLHRIFRRLTGVTPRAYAAARRAERLRKLLPDAPTVTAALHEAGFGSAARFYAEAGEMLGMPPSRFRRGGAGERIRFALGRSSLGAVLVAATPRGVCAIALGETPDALEADLAARFPRAELRQGGADFEGWVAAAVGLVEAPAAGFRLPLDLRGTAFQLRVWQALRGIPPGSTAAYGVVASRLGLPHGARAVARACAANPVAVAVPCHRVVAADGGLAGYRWGMQRKAALLRREARP